MKQNNVHQTNKELIEAAADLASVTPTCPPTFWNHAFPTLPRCTQCRAPRFRQVLCAI